MGPFLCDLPADTHFYQGEDLDGGLKILQPPLNSHKPQITNAASMALALTEICCEKGVGKVYVFAQNSEDKQYTDRIDAYDAFHELADLIYVHVIWSDKDKQEWRDMKPDDQLHLLSSRCLWLRKIDVVVPVALDFHLESSEHTRLGGYTAAPVTIYVSPQPRIGYTDEMRVALDHKRMPAKDEDGKFVQARYVGPISKLDDFLVNGGSGLVDVLASIFLNGRRDAKSTFGAELEKFIKAQEKAAEAGQAYGTEGEPGTKSAK